MDKLQRQACSATLLEAQAKLQAVRKRYKIRPETTSTDPAVKGSGSSAWAHDPTRPDQPSGLPAHLGWDNQALTLALRARLSHRQPAPPAPSAARQPGSKDPLPRREPTAGHNSSHPPVESGTGVEQRAATIKVYPDLAVAILRQKQAAVGRIWLLLGHVDEPGQGWVSLAEARRRLTDSRSPLRVCGWRQLRKLLARGEGLFWQRDEERIWLRSVARVAAGLDLSRLQGRPVALPLSVLLGSIRTVRAHFYASFHSGRQSSPDRRQHRPISRTVLGRLCGISRRTQRDYERRAGVRRRPNVAVGPPDSITERQQQSWRRGHAVFRFTDKRGLLGARGRAYVAWQLPNSYVGPHRAQPRGNLKQINRALADLSIKGMTGNGKAHLDGFRRSRRFCANGSAAARQYNRDHRDDRYWPSPTTDRRQATRLWYVLPGQEAR